VRDIPRSTFAHQDEARFIPLSAGNGELILLTYLRGPKGLTHKSRQTLSFITEVLMLSNIREIQGQYYHTCHKYYSCQWLSSAMNEHYQIQQVQMIIKRHLVH